MVICFFSTQYLPTPGGSSGTHGIWRGGALAAGHRALVVTAALRACPRGRPMPTASRFSVCVLAGHGRALSGAEAFAPADALWAQDIDFAVIQTRMYPQSIWAAHQCRRRGIPALVIDHSTGYMMHGGLTGALGRMYEHLACGSIRRCGFPFYGVSGDVCRWLQTFGIRAAGRLPNAVDPVELDRLAHARVP